MEMYTHLEPVTEEKLTRIEKKLKIVIPNSYRLFLLQYYGGQPKENNFYKELDTGGIYDFEIDSFLGFSSNLSFDLAHTYGIMLGQIPEQLLPIADDGTGNKICIGITGEYLGKVYIWWLDKANSEYEKPDFENIEKLANSFNEFQTYLR